MMETLRQKQSRFARSIALLIQYATARGYEVTLGDGYDPRGSNSGRSDKSLHRDRLALDLNLFIDGEWMVSTEAHRPLGEFWESLGEDYHWGGRFNDGNHYSLGWSGRK